MNLFAYSPASLFAGGVTHRVTEESIEKSPIGSR